MHHRCAGAQDSNGHHRHIPFELTHKPHPLIPAKAGIQEQLARLPSLSPWVPAFAGMSGAQVRKQPQDALNLIGICSDGDTAPRHGNLRLPAH